jgi:hypothetical protein
MHQYTSKVYDIGSQDEAGGAGKSPLRSSHRKPLQPLKRRDARQRSNRIMQEIGNIKPHPTVQEVDADLKELPDATIARLAANFDSRAPGYHKWEVLEVSERRAMRAANEQARRQRLAR